MAVSKKLRVGVVGLRMGKNHVKGFQAHPEAEVVAVCDQNPTVLAAVADELGVKGRYTQPELMFANAGLDAVSIATPNKFHAPLSIAALAQGLHVLCEKPMAMNAVEARQMNDAAQRAERTLMINFSYRFSDMSYALKQQVEAGAVGDIYFGRTVWHRRRGIPGLGGSFTNVELAGGGPLIDLGVHRLDLALWLMGYPQPVAVTGSAYHTLGREIAAAKEATFTVEDLACGLVKFANGATLVVEASWAVNIDEREHMVTQLCGTRGGLVQKNLGGEYRFTAEVYTEESGHLFTKKLDWSTVAAPTSYREFLDSIIAGRPPLATGEEGLKVMQILDGIYESARTGSEVRYPAPVAV
ncbi:MAG: Gfo/Idh/MocA family oxidoreductase [Armatimonadetes bacterium]|nr:Gfo/Idh/MocA family oxidoreductase [Armatimonadota bacterium]